MAHESAAHPHHPTHGHSAPASDGAVHAHISSVGFYAVIFAALICLTVLTVAQSYIDLGRLNLIVVLLIATTKASLVVSFFMHLRYDNKFNALIFISCLLFIGVFFTYTMNDTDHRGELDPDQNMKVLESTGENAPGGFVPHTADSAEHTGTVGATHDQTGGASPGSSASTTPPTPPTPHH